MRVDTFRRSDVERAECAQTLARQPRMHRAGRQDHWHRDFFRTLEAVGQYDMRSTRAHSILCLLADTLKPIMQAIFIRARGKGRVNCHHGIAKMLYHRVKLRVPYKRTVENKDLGLAAVFV